MKKLFTLFAVLAMFAFASCEENGGDDVNPNDKPNTEQPEDKPDDGNEDTEKPEDKPDDGNGNNTADDLVFLNNSNTAPTMVSGGGMVSISFKTAYSWTITKDVDWLTTSLSEGDAGTTSFFISASENKNDSERKGTVFINLSNGATYKVVVTQESNDGIQHLVCQDNEILYTTKYNYIVEKDFSGASGFGESASTLCVDHEYIDTYGKITFNNDVTKLPDNAFANCASMEIIYLPNGVKSVGKNAFKYCTALHSIISINSVDNNKALVIDGCLCAVAPANLVNYTIPAGVTKIGAGAFSGCKTLQRVVIPEGVVEIEAGAFEDCEKLNCLEIPNSLTTFGGDIITGECNDEIELVISPNHPNLLTYTTTDNQPIELYEYTNVLCGGFGSDGIGHVFYYIPEVASSQFYGCKTLKSVTIGSGITSIGGQAFYNCSSLTSITIPDSVTSIGDKAFYDCTSLVEVNCNAITPPALGTDVFINNAAGRIIYVPQGSKADYCAITKWRRYFAFSQNDKEYLKVGDLVDCGNARGVVFYIADNVVKLVSVSGTSTTWGPKGTATGATNESDGKANMSTIKFLDPDLSDYPAFRWCNSYGTGWYLPVPNELIAIYNNNSTINATLSANGYKTLNTGYCWSSTEDSYNYAYKIHFSNEYYYSSFKDDTDYVRAVLAF